MVRDTVRAFADERIIPIIDRHFEEATFPMGLIPEMAGWGLFGANLPEEYGCAGMNDVAYGLVMQELERGDSAIRSFASVQGALVMYPIFTFGTEERKRRWLPALAAGEKVGCFGLTEPNHGSDPGSMETHAVKRGDCWVLNGAKSWITNATIADIAVVWAKTADGIRGFLVEEGTKGFSAPEIKHKMSLRASVTSQLVFEDCEIPGENFLPGTGGLKSALMCLNQARYGIAWGTFFGQRHQQSRVIQKGDCVALLIEGNGPGGMYTGLGRTCVVGKAPQEMKDELAFTVAARRFTLDLLKPGTPCRDIWEAYNDFMHKNGRPPEARLYCHGQGYDLVERPLIRQDETFKIAKDMNIVVHPTYVQAGYLNWACDNYTIGANGPGERLHQFPEKIFEIG